jgi:hypothetical protein
MARVEVAGDQVTVQIEGMDRLWTFTSRLEIPLAHVHLADERYARLVIGVDDPAATVAAIRRALGTGGA